MNYINLKQTKFNKYKCLFIFINKTKKVFDKIKYYNSLWCSQYLLSIEKLTVMLVKVKKIIGFIYFLILKISKSFNLLSLLITLAYYYCTYSKRWENQLSFYYCQTFITKHSMRVTYCYFSLNSRFYFYFYLYFCCYYFSFRPPTLNTFINCYFIITDYSIN